VFTLTVSTTLDHRPAHIPQVAVKPLFPQCRDERGEQRDQETCVHEPCDSDNLAGGIFLSGWNSGGFTGDSGLVEGKKDCTKDGCRLIIRVWFELRVDIDDERRTDGREQTSLQ